MWLFVAALSVPGFALAQAEEAPRAVEPAPTLPAGPMPVKDSPQEPVAASASPSRGPAAVPDAVPAAPTAALQPVGRARGLVLIPYLGLNLPIDSMAEGYSAGGRLGMLAGWHLRPRISLNGEVTFDLMDADGDVSFVRPHEYFLDMCLSPLVHLRSGAIVLGPKLGWFVNHRWQTSEPMVSGNTYLPNLVAHHAQGIIVGLNLGGFVALGQVNLGMMATIAVRQMITSSCDDYACGSLVDPIELGLSIASLF